LRAPFLEEGPLHPRKMQKRIRTEVMSFFIRRRYKDFITHERAISFLRNYCKGNLQIIFEKRLTVQGERAKDNRALSLFNLLCNFVADVGSELRK
jgi:hypothetical protein